MSITTTEIILKKHVIRVLPEKAVASSGNYSKTSFFKIDQPMLIDFLRALQKDARAAQIDRKAF